MRYLIGFMFVLAGSAALPQSASAQAGEEGTTAEPASEEPVLQIELSPDGVDVMPSPARTADGYTLEEMELRVRRARIGLLSMTGVLVVGVALFGAGAASARSAQDWDALSRGGLLVAGMAVGLTGVAGMIVTGTLLGIRQGELRRLREARYEGRRRVQWDLAQSRLVF